MSDIKSIASALEAHMKNNTTIQGLDELYADTAVSIEAVAMGEASREAQGIAAIKGKHEWWENAMEVHNFEIRGPFFHGDDRFAFIFIVDASDKTSAVRNKMEEVGIYTVDHGKIVKEEFYYSF